MKPKNTDSNKDKQEPFHETPKLQGSDLFERPHPDSYADECQQSLSLPLPEEKKLGESVLVFRVLQEWLALKTYCIKEINDQAPTHALPHTSNEVLMGLTNIQGQLRITISLKDLIGFEEDPDSTSFQALSNRVYPRLLVFGIGKDDFVFPVDEVYGIHFIEEGSMQDVPLTVSKSLANFTTGIFYFQDTPIGLLEENTLFDLINNKYL